MIVSPDIGVRLASTNKKYWAYDNPGWFEPIVRMRTFGSWIANFWYYDASVSHLAECVLEDKEPLPSVEWGRHVVHILAGSIESARTGKAIDLATTF